MGSAPTQSAQPSTPSSAGKGTPTQNFKGQVLANQMTNDSRMNPTSAPTPMPGVGTTYGLGGQPYPMPTQIPFEGGKGQPGPTAVPTPMPTAVPPQGKGQPGMTPEQIGDMIRAMPNSPLASPNLGSGQPMTAQVPQPGYRSPVTQPKGPPLPYGHPGGTPKPGMTPYANIPPNAPQGFGQQSSNGTYANLNQMPLDTSRPAYNNYLAQAQFAPGGMPSYEQWVQQRTAAQNPAQNPLIENLNPLNNTYNGSYPLRQQVMQPNAFNGPMGVRGNDTAYMRNPLQPQVMPMNPNIKPVSPLQGLGSLPSGLATNLGNTLSNIPMNPNIYQ